MKSNQQVARFGLATLTAACVSCVMAQTNPYYVGVSQVFTRDSNLFRVADSQVKSVDLISTTSLLAGINQPIGRQRLFADANVRYNRFRDNDRLDYTGYGLNVGMDWATIERLSGSLAYSLNQTLASFSEDGVAAVTTTANRERSQQFLARGQLGLDGPLSLEAMFTHRRLDYSAASFAVNEFSQNMVSVGALYRPSGMLTLGTALRGTRGRYPFAIGTPGAFQADEYNRNDLDLTAVWTPTGQSTVAARLSFGKEDHDLVKARDFSGATGTVTWQYKPTGKLTFTTDLIRETGAEASFNGVSFANANPIGNNSQQSSAMQVRAVWEATAKIQVNAGARYTERDLVNGLISGGTDKTAQANLGAQYTPTRTWLLGCNLAREKRGGATPAPYNANIVGCSAQFRVD
jgi:hypothetical protein